MELNTEPWYYDPPTPPPSLFERCTEAEGYESFCYVNYTSWISC